MYDRDSRCLDGGSSASFLGQRFCQHGAAKQGAAGGQQGVSWLWKCASASDCAGFAFSLFPGFSGQPDEQGSFDQYDRASVFGISRLCPGDAGMVYLDCAVFYAVSGETEREPWEDGTGLRWI